ncbi:hypothetical protein N7541_003918 [Penicillium brevicompactum]|uniref:Uncharacterized protein n=1 Tax=Penicillium brevicompactum TaxID=5074 RepID=A0A9W9RPR5_PENBR|nr:hypothetical protein N7541_003918 [Penicillium brevicompactum]
MGKGSHSVWDELSNTSASHLLMALIKEQGWPTNAPGRGHAEGDPGKVLFAKVEAGSPSPKATQYKCRDYLIKKV